MTDLFQYTPTAFFAMASFAFVSSITPGPNNLMLLYSGARFGFNKTIPHWMGINIGFVVMIILCCLGIATLFFKLPMAQTALKVLGCAYMLWLAYKLFINGALPNDAALDKSNARKDSAKPLTFMQAAMFQYVNPKAWMMGLAVPASFLPTSGSIWINTLVAALVFGVINLLSMTVWVQGGVTLQTLMHKPNLAKAINILIVLMTLYCAASVWFPTQ